MASSSDFPARGKVLRADGGTVIFAPTGTTYELKLVAPGGYKGPIGLPVDGLIRLVGRKLWTVPSGGNFVTPIQGPTRIIQGRIKFLDAREMVVQAGFPVVVQLPAAVDAMDLPNGSLEVGRLVNCTIMPGATFQLAPALVAAR